MILYLFKALWSFIENTICSYFLLSNYNAFLSGVYIFYLMFNIHVKFLGLNGLGMHLFMKVSFCQCCHIILLQLCFGTKFNVGQNNCRVTCRDWFQLSLKEGLTVFRDQVSLTSIFIKLVADATSFFHLY